MQQFAGRAASGVAEPVRGDPVTGDLYREHWKVRVPGPTPTDPEGSAHAIAHADGTMSLHLRDGTSRTTLRLHVGQAAQLSTGIWEAATAAQHLTGHPNQDPPLPLPTGSAELPLTWRTPASCRAPADRSARRWRMLASITPDATKDARRRIGLRLRRLRQDRGKSLQVISGLAGMSSTTLHHVEHGRRDLTLSEIVVLAHALQTDPEKLIVLPRLGSANGLPEAIEREGLRPSPQ
ncbi:MAG: helix-turn-helix domain-containing protein [Pseudonocardiales bacterium]